MILNTVATNYLAYKDQQRFGKIQFDMFRHYNHVGHDMLIRSTRTMLKFCRDHRESNDTDFLLTDLGNILKALEADDFRSAAKQFRSLNVGPNSWTGWFPPVVYPHEDNDYVWEVFKALVERWYRLMSTAAGKSSK